MEDPIEAVARIIEEAVNDASAGEGKGAEYYACQIVQALTPQADKKISPYALPSQAADEYFTPPDESLLLSDEEIQEYAKEPEARGYPIKSGWLTPEIMAHIKDILEAQHALDMEECEKRVREIIQLVEDSEALAHITTYHKEGFICNDDCSACKLLLTLKSKYLKAGKAR